MKESQQVASSSGIGLGGATFIVFLVLKLTNQIDWSWWWVTAPLWAPLAILLALATVAAAIWGIICLFGLFIISKKK